MRRSIFGLVAAASLVLISACAAMSQSKSELDPQTGQFHRQHAQTLGMACNACHANEQKDILFLRKDERQANGPVDRSVCLGCHQAPAKPAWYGASSR